MDRQTRRVERAIERAAFRSPWKTQFVAPSGAVLRVDAVRKTIPFNATTDGGAISQTSTSEFVVSRTSFQSMLNLCGGTVDLFGGASSALRGAKLRTSDGATSVEWRFDQEKPFEENDPHSASVRLFCYRAKR